MIRSFLWRQKVSKPESGEGKEKQINQKGNLHFEGSFVKKTDYF